MCRNVPVRQEVLDTIARLKLPNDARLNSIVLGLTCLLVITIEAESRGDWTALHQAPSDQVCLHCQLHNEVLVEELLCNAVRLQELLC